MRMQLSQAAGSTQPWARLDHRPRKVFESEGHTMGHSGVECQPIPGGGRGVQGQSPWWRGIVSDKAPWSWSKKVSLIFRISHFAVALFTAFHSSEAKRSTEKIFTHEKVSGETTLCVYSVEKVTGHVPPPLPPFFRDLWAWRSYIQIGPNIHILSWVKKLFLDQLTAGPKIIENSYCTPSFLPFKFPFPLLLPPFLLLPSSFPPLP